MGLLSAWWGKCHNAARTALKSGVAGIEMFRLPWKRKDAEEPGVIGRETTGLDVYRPYVQGATQWGLKRIPWIGSKLGTVPFVGGVLALVVVMGVGIVLAAGGAKNPAVQYLQCAPSQQSVAIQAGQNDNFNPNPDTPPASPSAALSALLTSGNIQIIGFDMGPAVGVSAFAHTFTNLPANILAAELEVGAKPLDLGPLAFWFSTQDDTVNVSVGPYDILSGFSTLAGGPWDVANYPSGATVFVNFSSNPSLIAQMSNSQTLDVIVFDWTMVDYLVLRLCTGSSLTPIVVGTGVGKATHTPTPAIGPIGVLTPLPVTTNTPTPAIGPIGGLTPVAVATATPVPAPTDTPVPTHTPPPAPTSTPPPPTLTPTLPATVTPTRTPRPTNTAAPPTPTRTCTPGTSC